jgi:hypothetical protein
MGTTNSFMTNFTGSSKKTNDNTSNDANMKESANFYVCVWKYQSVQ